MASASLTALNPTPALYKSPTILRWQPPSYSHPKGGIVRLSCSALEFQPLIRSHRQQKPVAPVPSACEL